MHIAIAGNIGSGKTTLTKMLAHRYGWTPRFEPVDNNPYLEDFYADMKRWSFNLQIYFLNKRFKEVVEIAHSKETIIQDRTIFEDACIFAPNLHGQGMMSDRDFANYKDLFDLMMSLVQLPDLMIYIRSSIPRWWHRSRNVAANTSRPCVWTIWKVLAATMRNGLRPTRASSSLSTATTVSLARTLNTSSRSPT